MPRSNISPSGLRHLISAELTERCVHHRRTGQGQLLQHLNVKGWLKGLDVLLKGCSLVPAKWCQVRIQVPFVSNVVETLAVPYKMHNLAQTTVACFC